MEGLTRRELSVLAEVVKLYIRSGQPVASKEVVRHCDLGLSAATLRSIMAGLEAAGYLFRPHSSAGCTPSDSAYRIYVDSLKPRRTLPARTRRQLQTHMAAMQRELVEDIEWVARVVADATRGAGVAVRPMEEEPVLEATSLVALSGSRVLGVLVTADGTVEKRLLDVGSSWQRRDLEAVSNWVNRRFHGMTLEEIRNVLSGLDGREVESQSWPYGERGAEVVNALFARGNEGAEVRVAGAENLLQDESFARVERVRSLLAVLQDRTKIAREWRRVFRGGRTQVIIGHESEVTASGDLGMVATLFFREGHQVGAVGVVGSRRMDYGRIVPVVEFIGDSLTRMLEGGGVQHA